MNPFKRILCRVGMLKKGQVAIVAAVMIIILVILAILLAGHLFSKKTVISVKGDDTVGTVFFVKTQDMPQDDMPRTYYTDRGCCNKDTFIRYHEKETVPPKKMYDTFHHVPTCCDRHVYTYHHTERKEYVERPHDTVFDTPTCYN